MDSTTVFPSDLVQAQRDLNAAYQALSASHPASTTALRRRLLRLSAHIRWHPYWNTCPVAVSVARTEMRRMARSPQRSVGAA